MKQKAPAPPAAKKKKPVVRAAVKKSPAKPAPKRQARPAAQKAVKTREQVAPAPVSTAIVKEERAPVRPVESAEIQIDAMPRERQLPEGKILPFEIDPKQIEEGFARLRDEVSHWAKKGRYTKVRFKFRGKPLLPDMPLAAVMAAEGLTFYWGGLLRALIFNIAGKSVIDVELVNDSEKRIQQGREALLSADVEKALSCFREAIAMDRDNPAAHLSLGVALKLKGDREGAKTALARVKALVPDSPLANEADKVLQGL